MSLNIFNVMISVRIGVIIIKIYFLFLIYNICLLPIINITPVKIVSFILLVSITLLF
jgi:hypothetical protein